MPGSTFQTLLGGSSAANNILSFTASVSQTSGGGTLSGGRTYNTVSIGTPAPNRYIVVVAGIRCTGTVYETAVTVAGTNMNLVTRDIDSVTNSTVTSMWISPIPITTGTTATIVTSYQVSAVTAEGLGVYAIYGLKSVSPVATSTDSSSTSPILNLNVNSGGIVIAGAYAGGQGVSIGSWTGVTSDYNLTCTTGGNLLGGASASLCPAASPRTVSLTYGVASNIEAAAVAASFS